MITIIICAIIGIVTGIITFWDDFLDSILDFIGDIMMTIVMGGLGGILGMCIAFTIPTHLEYKKTIVEIVSLKNNSTLSGRFFVGSGKINGVEQYSFYYKYNGGFINQVIPADKTIIFYSNNKPTCVEYKLIKNNDFINKFSFSTHEGDISYEIYIPEGTIKQEFTLNSE